MTQIIFNSKVHNWNSKLNEFSMSEKHVPQFDSEYSILNPITGVSKQFKLSHSTGSEWDPNTEWIYKSECGISLIIQNDERMTAIAADNYLNAKLRS